MAALFFCGYQALAAGMKSSSIYVFWMPLMTDISPETLAARGALEADGSVHPVVPPLLAGTTYLRDQHYQLPAEQGSYIRLNNPGQQPAEQLLAKLEHGTAAALFASGTAAASAIVLALKPGDRIVVPRVMYSGLRDWLITFCERWGLTLAFYDGESIASLSEAVAQAPTQMVWLETPSNPMWDLTDIRAAAQVGKDAGAWVVVDSTVATPVLTQPLSLGADLVFHSATKYLNGHSDVIAGAVVTARDHELWQAVVQNRIQVGAVLGAFESWLLLRGMRTLFLRVRQACESALAIALFLEQHDKVSQVLYPGLPSHAGHQLAKQQMKNGYSGMLSVRIEGGAQAALQVAGACKVFLRATSLGGVESLIEHRRSIEGEDSPVPGDLLRLSIGIESVDDLKADLAQALARL